MLDVLITSGGTREKIDEVRCLTNISSGRFGRLLADEAASNDLSVEYFSHKHSVKPMHGSISMSTFDSYQDYHDGLLNLIREKSPKCIVLCAAVSDFTVKKQAGKIESGKEQILTLLPTEKVINKIRAIAPNAYIIGFKLLSWDSMPREYEGRHEDRYIHDKCTKLLIESSCDVVCGNYIEDVRKGERNIFWVTKYTQNWVYGMPHKYIIGKIIDRVKNG